MHASYLVRGAGRAQSVVGSGRWAASIYLLLCEMDATWDAGWVASQGAIIRVLRAWSGVAPRKKTISKAVSGLVDSGCISTEPVDGNRTRYRVLVPEEGVTDVPEVVTSVTPILIRKRRRSLRLRRRRRRSLLSLKEKGALPPRTRRTGPAGGPARPPTPLPRRTRTSTARSRVRSWSSPTRR